MKKQWKIDTGDGTHSVEFSKSFWGIVTVTIDGYAFRLGYVGMGERNEPFRVGDSQCMLIMKGRKVEIHANDCEVEKVGV